MERWNKLATLINIKIDGGNTYIVLTSELLRDLQTTKKSFKEKYSELVNIGLSSVCLKSTPRLEECLRIRCVKAVSMFSKLKGRKRNDFGKKVQHIQVLDSELESVTELRKRLNTESVKNIVLEEQLKGKTEELNNSSFERGLTKCRLTESLEKNVRLEENLKALSSKNKELSNYVERLQTRPKINRGKEVHALKSPSGKVTKLRSFASAAGASLWFAESYGLKPEAISCSSPDGKVTVQLSGSKEKVSDGSEAKELSYLMDRFCISDEAMHEICMKIDGAPRSYLIAQARNDMNSIFRIERTPNNPGAWCSAYETVSNLISKTPDIDKTKPIVVKFSGDGAKMSNHTNYVIITVCLPNRDKPDLSSDAHKVLAILKGSESYETLSTSFTGLFDELNTLFSAQEIEVDGQSVKLSCKLGGDMKFLYTMIGMKGATSLYSCIWCLIHKTDRFDTSKDMDYYEQQERVRNLGEVVHAIGKKTDYGMKNSPILHVNVDDIVLDELHLLLRIVDILLDNLIVGVRNQDQSYLVMHGKSRETSFQDLLVADINACGIAFAIWTPRDAKKGAYTYTSLTAGEKKVCLKQLPPKLIESDALDQAIRQPIVKLWSDFYDLYIMAVGLLPDPVEVFRRAKMWIDDFLSLGGKLFGYQKANVTPYMHCLIYHVPAQITRYGNIKQFSGQGVEKKNDVVKSIHHRKSNRWDGTKEALLACKRIEKSEEDGLKRHKRKYTKSNLEHWNSGIFEIRKKKKAAIAAEIDSGN